MIDKEQFKLELTLLQTRIAELNKIDLYDFPNSDVAGDVLADLYSMEECVDNILSNCDTLFECEEEMEEPEWAAPEWVVTPPVGWNTLTSEGVSQ